MSRSDARDNSKPPRGEATSFGWRVVRVVRFGLAVYLSLVLLMMFFEESLIYFPIRYPEGDWAPAGLEFEDATFETSDGVRLHGWYVPHDDPRAVLLFSHGNAGNITHRAHVLRTFERLGVAVLIYDYRGYGRSEGSPNEEGVIRDARAARAWLAQRAGVAEEQIVLLGRSLGSAVSVQLAAQDGARGLVLESSFTSMPDVAAKHYPWLPVRLVMRNRFDSAEVIGRYHGPLLQSHGDRDTIIPIELGRRLFELANEPKQFYVLRGSDHNDPHPAEYYEVLDAWLEELDGQ